MELEYLNALLKRASLQRERTQEQEDEIRLLQAEIARLNAEYVIGTTDGR